MCTHHGKYNINVASMTRDLPGDNIGLAYIHDQDIGINALS